MLGETRTVCKHCSEENCYEHCQKTESGEHEPDPYSITRADVDEGEGCVVDICCKHCGMSGSYKIEDKDINW